MSTLSEQFEAIRAKIEDRSHPTVHYPLLPILEAVNPNRSREFNRAALSANGIDPDIFRAAWALGFAKETVVMNGSHIIHRQAAHSRCNICLSMETPDSFGHYLPDDMKDQLRRKQEELAPHI